mgnify:CR=1 FL=1
MAINKRLLVKPPSTGITPSEHFGVVLYEGDSSSSHSINGGKFGAAFYGNGSNSRINLGNGKFTLNELSISVWVKPSGSGYRTILENYEYSGGSYGFILRIDQTTGKARFVIYNGDCNNPYPDDPNCSNVTAAVSTNAIPTNAYTHIVVTMKIGELKMYINGSLDVSTVTQAIGYTSGAPTNIGASSHTYATNGESFYEGKIDQLRVFSKVLSSSEVSTLYAETVDTVESLDPLSEDTTDTLQVLGDSSCIATYRFENNEDDESGNFNGTGTAIQYAAGRYGQAASFNGTASRISTSLDFDNYDENWSISYWVKFTFDTNYRAILGSTDSNVKNGMITDIGTSGEIRFRLRDNTGSASSLSSTNTYGDGSWHHVVCVKGSSTNYLYIDGALDSSTATTNGINHSALNLGTFGLSSSEFFKGELDQVRVFNKAISASEVTTLYQENSLIASYRFEGNANDDMRAYDGTATNVTYEYGLNFTPDFVWLKNRDVTRNHRLVDSTRGATKHLIPNLTNAESTTSTNVASFDSGGFTVGSAVSTNEDGSNFVAWCLKANGGTTSSNTDGTITSTVQANTDAGFSIIKYTGNSTAGATIGHGLSAVPQMIIVKRLESPNDNWAVYNETIGNTKRLALDESGAAASNRLEWNSTTPSATTFTLGNHSAVNTNSSYIAYCFHSVDGFSKFGTYIGNGSSNGPIVETGFEPAFLMIKRTSATDNWVMIDNKRSTTNPRNKFVWANKSDAESTFAGTREVNFYSNGFQPVSDGSDDINDNNATYIYMAFAADPDTEAPTLARSFNIATYTGNQTTRSIDGLGFSPSLIWFKERTSTSNHVMFDVVRGVYNQLYITSSAESNNTATVSSFDSDGWSMNNGMAINENTQNYVAWAWKADDNEPTALFNSAVTGVYKFEDNVNDVAGNNNGASAVSLSYTSSGKFNKAVVSNGSNSEVSLSQTPAITTAWTFSFWFYATANSGIDVILQTGTGFAIGLEINKIFIFTGGSNRGNGTSISLNAWYHYAATYDGTSVKTYLNGSLAETITTLTGMSGGNLKLFDSPYGTWGHYEGRLDQLRVYSIALSSTEITALYNESTSDNDTVEFPDGLANGSVNSTVSANANAGFSIVKYEGDGQANHKIQHGLSSAPEFVIIKNLNDTEDWQVFGNTLFDRMQLNNNGGDDGNFPLSYSASTITLPQSGQEANNAWNASGDEYIAYCFHSVSGFSKFGSYTGTGSSNSITGLGFAPDFVLLKSSTSAENWVIFDSLRGSKTLYPNANNVESSFSTFTFDSDGFTVPGSSGMTNGSGQTYIYVAFKIN